MFKVGDKVVCIDDSVVKGTLIPIHLTLYKTYTVLKYNDFYLHRDDCIHIIDDNHQNKIYFSNKFISLTEYRRLKLEKICSRLVTK